jgi:hypothetical protein
MQTVSTSPLPNVFSMAASNGKVFISQEGEGVGIYAASRSSFGLIRHLSAAEIGASVGDVGALENVLYVATYDPDQIRAYDVSDPADPALIATLAVPAGVNRMRQAGDEALVVLNSEAATLTFIDVRVPDSPVLAATVVDLDSSLAQRLRARRGDVAVRVLEGTALAEIDNPGAGDELLIGQTRTISPTSTSFARSAGRFYVLVEGCIDKYDILHPDDAAYLMERFHPGVASLGLMFVHDPDGPAGPAPETLYVGSAYYGFRAYAP